MAKKAGATDSITLTGGCAKNEGLKRAIEHVLKIKVVDLPIDLSLWRAWCCRVCKAKGDGINESFNYNFNRSCSAFCAHILHLFFNLDMKLVRKIYDALGKHYDSLEKDRKL